MPAIHEFPPLTLCAACQQLFNPPPKGKSYIQTSKGRLRLFGASSEDETDHAIFGPDELGFQKRRKDIEKACGGGCEICQWILLNDQSCDLSEHDEEGAGNFTEEDFRSGRRPSWWPPEDEELDFYFKYDEESGELSLVPCREEQWGCRQWSWYVWTTRENPAAKLPIPRVSLADIGSLERLANVRQALNECVAKHKRCPDNKSVELPTRLVEVSPPGAPESAHLRTTRGETGSYATLSYCWGGPQPFQTITKSFADYSTALPYSNLPRTLLDAFEVTRSLGLRYIWIDSLCIIQDDSEDKKRELPQMLRIYESSFITISAGSVSSCNEGFLDPRLNSRSPRHLCVRVDDKQIGTLLVGKQSETIEFGEHISQPINNRAWTLQESWIAPRLLVFGGLTVVWKCACTEWQDGQQKRLRGTDDDDDDDDSDYWDYASGYVTKQNSNLTHHAWHDLIENYTRRALTYQGDKLPAISAVAEKFAPFFGGGVDYLAGLWRKHLLFDLLWYAGEGERKFTDQAPSWSWASNAGSIKFLMNHAKGLYPDLSSSCSILECSVVLAAEGLTYGAVVGGELVVEGYMADLGGQVRELANMSWDDPEQFDGGSNGEATRPCWTLTIATHSLRGTECKPEVVFGLILTDSKSGNGSFRRVGYFQLESIGRELPDYWQGQGRRVVKIV